MANVQDFILRFRGDDTLMFDRIEEVRNARGMTRKGFLMHAIANTYPELTNEIVAWLMTSTPRNRQAIERELDE